MLLFFIECELQFTKKKIKSFVTVLNAATKSLNWQYNALCTGLWENVVRAGSGSPPFPAREQSQPFSSTYKWRHITYETESYSYSIEFPVLRRLERAQLQPLLAESMCYMVHASVCPRKSKHRPAEQATLTIINTSFYFETEN